jgi:hypothetical protein
MVILTAPPSISREPPFSLPAPFLRRVAPSFTECRRREERGWLFFPVSVGVEKTTFLSPQPRPPFVKVRKVRPCCEGRARIGKLSSGHSERKAPRPGCGHSCWLWCPVSCGLAQSISGRRRLPHLAVRYRRCRFGVQRRQDHGRPNGGSDKTAYVLRNSRTVSSIKVLRMTFYLLLGAFSKNCGFGHAA